MWYSQSNFPLVLRISLTLWLTQVRVKCKQTSISKIYQCSNDCTGSSIGKDFNTWPINTEQIIYRRLTTLSKCNLTLAFGFGVFPAQGCVWGSKLKCDSYFYRDKHLGQFHRLFFPSHLFVSVLSSWPENSLKCDQPMCFVWSLSSGIPYSCYVHRKNKVCMIDNRENLCTGLKEYKSTQLLSLFDFAFRMLRSNDVCEIPNSSLQSMYPKHPLLEFIQRDHT